MKIYMLDVVDAGAYDKGLWVFIAVIVLTILVEMFMMHLLKFNAWKKCLLDAAVVNILSMVAGMLLVQLVPELFNNISFVNLLKLFGVTLLIETPVLFLLNREKTFRNTAMTSLTMNLVSYSLYAATLLL